MTIVLLQFVIEIAAQLGMPTNTTSTERRSLKQPRQSASMAGTDAKFKSEKEVAEVVNIFNNYADPGQQLYQPPPFDPSPLFLSQTSTLVSQ